MSTYWVVGAMWAGTEDVLETFLRRGYWYCWDPKNLHQSKSDVGNSISAQQERLKQIQLGDRIAVKKMLGQGAKEIEIRALGIVEDVDLDEWRVYVRWLTDHKFSRRVAIRGCTASVHGPFQSTDEWVREVFCI